MELHVIIRGMRAVEGYTTFKAWICNKFGINDDDSEIFIRIRQEMLKEHRAELPDILLILDENAKMKDLIKKMSETIAIQKDRIQSLEAQWAMQKIDPIKPSQEAGLLG
jgi:hypothetical protein